MKFLEQMWISRQFTVWRFAWKDLVKSNRLMSIWLSIYLLLVLIFCFSCFGLIGLFHSRLEFRIGISLFFTQFVFFLFGVSTFYVHTMISQDRVVYRRHVQVIVNFVNIVASLFFTCIFFLTTLDETKVFRLFSIFTFLRKLQ